MDAFAQIKCPDWEWPDVDTDAQGKQTLVYATGGCLYRANIQSHSKIGKPKLLHDFNDYVFEERVAPYGEPGWRP